MADSRAPSDGTRTRDLPFLGGNAWYRSRVYKRQDKAWGSWTTSSGIWKPKNLQGKQVTVSESHPGWRRLNASGPDIGGDFFTQRVYTYADFLPEQYMSGIRNVNTLDTQWEYKGPVVPWSFSGITFPSTINSSQSELDKAGATAIALTKPTNSLADLASGLLELVHEGIPKVLGARTWEQRTIRANYAAEDYLNLEFGYKPLVGEILSVVSVISQADALIHQYLRDAGKVVRRRMELQPFKETQHSIFKTTDGPYTPVSSSLMYLSDTFPPAEVHRYREIFKRRWFSGAYTYHIPDSNSLFANMMAWNLEAKKLLGLSLTPKVLWDFMPWSWAVDWFTNAGDVISNLTDMATDGLVLKYGYLMEHSYVKDYYTWSGPTNLVNPWIKPSPITMVAETKVRRKANPFGFGLTWEGLADRQKAILVALGLSRSSV